MPRRPRQLTGVVALVDVAALIAALVTLGVHTGSGRPSPAAASRPGRATSAAGPSVAAGAPTTGAPNLPALPTSTPSASSSRTAPGRTTTLAPIVTPVGGPATPGPVTSTPPGTYVYTASAQSDRQSSTTTLNETVVDESNTNGELRQSVTDKSSDNSLNARQEVSWRAVGLYLRSMDFTFGGAPITCNFVSPVLELALPLAVGKQWPVQGMCTVSYSGAQDTVKVQGAAHVSGVERVAVGSQPVDVWVVDGAVDLIGSGTFPFDIHETRHTLVTGQGIVAADKSTMTNVPFAGTVTADRELRSLKPN